MKAKKLIEKYRAGLCSEEELIQLQNWFHELELHKELGITDEHLNEIELRNWSVIERETQPPKNRMWSVMAAAMVLVLGIGFSYYTLELSNHPNLENTAEDILPGGNKAFLILGNGKRISLTDAKNGSIASQGGIEIKKTADGKLMYAVKELDYAAANVSNTIETPIGGQYQVTLPDGTLVVLNTASSLTFPASFAARKERKVVLKGEAYFEVVKNRKMPFIVATRLQQVTVLGTHFNINAYTEENAIRTTLLEGSVKVSHNELVKQLSPGEQAALNEDTFSVKMVDVESVIAWQNGNFTFENEPVESVMRQIARWYNIEVIYKGDLSHIKLLGSVSRSKKLSEVLRVLQLSRKVRFKVEGRRVIVMP